MDVTVHSPFYSKRRCMKLSNFLIDIGKVVAYYPSLKQVTGSTTATIFLCQMIYWSDKTSKGDGWIFKTSGEIEEETGLTYNEQKTARKVLVEKKLLKEERHRLDHDIGYKVDHKELNKQWEALHPHKEEEEEERVVVKLVVPAQEIVPVVPVVPEIVPVEEVVPPRRSAVEKKGDLLDGFLFYAKSDGMKVELKMDEIRGKFATRFHVNLNRRWDDLIKHAYTRETKFNEPVDKFIDWWIVNGGSPIYWTPEKMQLMYPQAYLKTEEVKKEGFVTALPKSTEEELVSMPRELKSKN